MQVNVGGQGLAESEREN